MNLSGKFFQIVILILVAALVFTAVYWFVMVHEMVHVQIAEREGCETSEINYMPLNLKFAKGKGVALASVNFSCSDYKTFEEVSDRQEIVDIVGYQLFPIYFILVLILVLQIKSAFLPAKRKCCKVIEEL